VEHLAGVQRGVPHPHRRVLVQLAAIRGEPNTGRPFRADKETRVAKNTLHLSAKYPSHILLPFYDAANDR
jgi:hypothetical protein